MTVIKSSDIWLYRWLKLFSEIKIFTAFIVIDLGFSSSEVQEQFKLSEIQDK